MILSPSFSQGLTKYAFAQEGQGQVRCTNGQLVRSPTECPATDLCPPPPGPTTVAYCSPREPSVRSAPHRPIIVNNWLLFKLISQLTKLEILLILP